MPFCRPAGLAVVLACLAACQSPVLPPIAPLVIARDPDRPLTEKLELSSCPLEIDLVVTPAHEKLRQMPGHAAARIDFRPFFAEVASSRGPRPIALTRLEAKVTTAHSYLRLVIFGSLDATFRTAHGEVVISRPLHDAHFGPLSSALRDTAFRARFEKKIADALGAMVDEAVATAR
jgi:hypothetical protein